MRGFQSRQRHRVETIHPLYSSQRAALRTTMAPGQKLYPRATVKKIIKAHSDCNVSKNADVMVWSSTIRIASGSVLLMLY